MARIYQVPTLTKSDINQEQLQADLTVSTGYNLGLSWNPSRQKWLITVFDNTNDGQIQAIIDGHNKNVITKNQQIEIDKTGILALANQAKNFTPEIKAIWSAIVNADYNADDTNTRFTAIRAAVAAQGDGFKNALHTALESETGLTSLVLDATPTATEKQAYNQWIRSFCLTWAFMIVLA